jgi:hypothetical protein
MNTFPPSHAIIGSALFQAFGTGPFQLLTATNHLYRLVDEALQRAGYQWAQDFEAGVQGTTGFRQKISGGPRTITAETDPLVVVVLRFSRDLPIRSTELQSYLQGLIEDFVWLAYEKGLAAREYTSWKLLEPNAPLAQEESNNESKLSSGGRSTPKRQRPTIARPAKSITTETSSTTNRPARGR